MDSLPAEYAEVMRRLAAGELAWNEWIALGISAFRPGTDKEKLNLYFWLMSWQWSDFVWAVLGILVLIAVVRILWLWFKMRDKTQYVFLEVTPPHTTLQSGYSTSELFNYIHTLARPMTWKDWWLDRRKRYSFELVASKQEGIRYILRVPKTTETSIRQAIISFLPAVKIREVDDYLSQEPAGFWEILEFYLWNSFCYPMKSKKSLDEHDPIAYVTGTMTKLDPGELMVMQVVTRPAGKQAYEKAREVLAAIHGELDAFAEIGRKERVWFLRVPILIIKVYLFVCLSVFTVVIGMVILMLTFGAYGNLFPHLYWFFPNRRRVKYSDADQEVVEGIAKKLNQQLFESTVKVYVQMNSKERLEERKGGVIAFMHSFDTTMFQELSRNTSWLRRLIMSRSGIAWRLLRERSQILGKSSIFSGDELTDLYHFPFTDTTKTEGLVRSMYRELPAPLSLKKDENRDVVFAKNEYGGSFTYIGLSAEERRRHMYILGATGTGKSTLLASMIGQDLSKGKGLAVVDPHGDLVESLLNLVPESRIKDVVYFNPDDVTYPAGINLLELTPGLDEDDALKEKEFIAESVLSLFLKVFSDKNMGPRMEYILRNTIHTAFTVEGATLFTVYELLLNKTYRKSVVKNIDDKHLKEFWKLEFGKAGSYQTVQMISPITNKIGRFLFSPSAKRILEQEKSTINFDEILNEGKILLCNLSKGKLGEGISELLGITIMTKIQLAALKRARIDMRFRKDFYLYVDEFQNFATPAFGQILSEARKYKLNAVLAHQTTSQLEDKSLVNVTLANTGTVICFRTANPLDEELILPQFAPNVEKGDIANLPAYHFYMRMAALDPEETFSGVTIDLQIEKDEALVKKIVATSRKLYAKKHEKSEEKPKAIRSKKKVTTKRTKKDKDYYPSALG